MQSSPPYYKIMNARYGTGDVYGFYFTFVTTDRQLHFYLGRRLFRLIISIGCLGDVLVRILF
jgi:hypothetical protein